MNGNTLVDSTRAAVPSSTSTGSSADNVKLPQYMVDRRHTYYLIDQAMMAAHNAQFGRGREAAEEFAKLLLAAPSLPLPLRARACMVLRCTSEAEYAEWVSALGRWIPTLSVC